MRLNISVGVLEGGNAVSVRRCEDGNINIVVTNKSYRAVYQRTQNGILLLTSTYPEDQYDSMYNALTMNLVEIDRRCIELSEAELRIPYHAVVTDNGNRISVGQSNSLIIYIAIENFEHRALFNFNGSTCQFIRSSYPPEDGVMLTDIIRRNLPQILAVMEQYNMIERKDDKVKPSTRLYKERFVATMTETGKEEREKLDRSISDVFQELNNKGYSNLEIQSMMLESVIDIALQFRTKKGNVTNKI